MAGAGLSEMGGSRPVAAWLPGPRGALLGVPAECDGWAAQRSRWGGVKWWGDRVKWLQRSTAQSLSPAR